MTKYGLGMMNERKNGLVEFCNEQNLFITNIC